MARVDGRSGERFVDRFDKPEGELADDEELDETDDGADPVVRLHGDLAWDGSDRRRPVVLHRGEPLASFECRSPGERRVLTRLEFLGGRRSIDVTVQPDTISHLLRRLAIRANDDGNAWQRQLKRRLLVWSTEMGIADALPADDALASVIASLGFPMVRLARDRGVLAPPHVPRWAEPVLAGPDVRAAASAAFGDRSSRRVARALAASLAGDTVGVDDGEAPEVEAAGPAQRPMALMPLGLALALPQSVSADVIANMLMAPTADHAAQYWPSVYDLHLLRRGFRMLGPSVSAHLATEALATITGPGRLIRLIVHVPRLLSIYDGPAPRHIDDLDAVVIEFVRPPVEPVAQRQPAGPARCRAGADAPRVAACEGEGVIDLPVQPLYVPGPVQAIAVGPDDEFRYPDAVLRLHGASSGAHSIWLPRSGDELRRWGRELDNCMADYCEHVACDRSVILGLRRHDRLVAGVELTRDLHRVRQFVRDGNQRPWTAERNALRDILARLGVAGA